MWWEAFLLVYPGETTLITFTAEYRTSCLLSAIFKHVTLTPTVHNQYYRSLEMFSFGLKTLKWRHAFQAKIQKTHRTHQAFSLKHLVWFLCIRLQSKLQASHVPCKNSKFAAATVYLQSKHSLTLPLSISMSWQILPTDSPRKAV